MCWRTMIVLACACSVLASAAHASPARRALSDLAARRRSMTDKNFMRFGRSDPDNQMDASSVRMHLINSGIHRVSRGDQHLRFGRARPDIFLRLGRGGSAQASFPLQGSLRQQMEKHYPDYPELTHNFLEEELVPQTEKRRLNDVDFLRLGRGNSNFLRLGRSAPTGETDQDFGSMDFVTGEDNGTGNEKVFYDDDFMRYGRSGDSESALEIDLPAGAERKRRDTKA